MRKNSILFLMLLAFVVITGSCKKEEVTTKGATLSPVQKQWGLVLEYTAKWCGPCGQWGAPTMTDLCKSSPYVVGIAAHASGDPMYIASLYNALNADRTNGGGIPAFWIGDKKSQQASDLNSLLGKTCTAAIDLSFTKTATTMTVNTQTKFFTATSGEYYLSVFVLESGVDGGTTATSDYKQNGTSDPNFLHERILRESSIKDKPYGESIATGSIAAGKTINKTYTIALNSTWTKTLYPVAILWKYDASTTPSYQFVNCFKK